MTVTDIKEEQPLADRKKQKNQIRQRILQKRDALPEELRRAYSRQITEKVLETDSYRQAENILIYVSFRSEVETMELIRCALQDGKRVYLPRVMPSAYREKSGEMEFFRVMNEEEVWHLELSKWGIPEPPALEGRKFIPEIDPESDTKKMPKTVSSIVPEKETEAMPSIMPEKETETVPSTVSEKETETVPSIVPEKEMEIIPEKEAENGVHGCTLMIMPGAAFDRDCNRIGYAGGFYDRYLERFPACETIALAFSLQVTDRIPAEIHDRKPSRIMTEKGQLRNGGSVQMKKTVEEICRDGAGVKYEIQRLSTEKKNEVLKTAAKLLVDNEEEILKANQQDIDRAKESGMRQAMQDRLLLTGERIAQMAEGLLQVAELPDPNGEVIEEFTRPNGLSISRVRVPLGVIGIIYESRPNVTADAFALCFKAGNASILKGGSDALSSNEAITGILQKALAECGVNPNAVQLIATADRSAAKEFMKMREYVDVLIPRGGAGLIRAVVEESDIPVIETGTGNCHIYVDKDADLTKAVSIVVNAKTQRISVCNAAESLVVHEAVKESFLPLLAQAMKEHSVELRADEQARPFLPDAVEATPEDFGKEYLDYIMSVKTVSSLEEAIAHINHYNTGHSDCIVTENKDSAEQFLDQVDAACVYVNASTRFTDGFEFGFGAEIGISTQKLHARGPMGLPALTSYKYQIRGNGQVRG